MTFRFTSKFVYADIECYVVDMTGNTVRVGKNYMVEDEILLGAEGVDVFNNLFKIMWMINDNCDLIITITNLLSQQVVNTTKIILTEDVMERAVYDIEVIVNDGGADYTVRPVITNIIWSGPTIIDPVTTIIDPVTNPVTNPTNPVTNPTNPVTDPTDPVNNTEVNNDEGLSIGAIVAIVGGGLLLLILIIIIIISVSGSRQKDFY